MNLSDLLGSEAYADGERLGYVVDVRFVVRGRTRGVLADAELVGLVIGPRDGAAFLGYERSEQARPALLNRYFAHRQRGSFLVDWDDVEHIGDDRVDLRNGFTRWSSTMTQ